MIPTLTPEGRVGEVGEGSQRREEDDRQRGRGEARGGWDQGGGTLLGVIA